MHRIACVSLSLGLLTACGIGSAPGQENKPMMRMWADDTGKHTVVAEFVEIRENMVRLKKKNGTIISVPLARLSQSDRDYVTSRKQSDAPSKQPPPSDVRNRPPADAKPLAKQTSECCFQISGLMHRREMQRFLNRTIPTYHLCRECFKAIRGEEGFRELGRHVATTQYKAGPGAQQNLLGITTTGRFPLSTDLGPVAKAVVAAKTPHPTKRAFYVLLFARLNANQARAVQGVIARLNGVDHRGSAVDLRTGRIRVEISGGQAIRMADLVAAFKDAGLPVKTNTDRPFAPRR